MFETDWIQLARLGRIKGFHHLYQLPITAHCQNSSTWAKNSPTLSIYIWLHWPNSMQGTTGMCEVCHIVNKDKSPPIFPGLYLVCGNPEMVGWVSVGRQSVGVSLWSISSTRVISLEFSLNETGIHWIQEIQGIW